MSTSAVFLTPAPRTDPKETAKTIAEACEKRSAEEAKQPKRLNLQHLSVLQREIDDLKFRLADQQRRAPQLVNVVADLEQRIADLRKAKKRLEDGGDIVQAYVPLGQIDKKLAHLDSELAGERRRLDTCEKLIASYTKLIDEWRTSASGREYAELLKLQVTIDNALPRIGGITTSGGLF